jgi:hypothetical protein
VRRFAIGPPVRVSSQTIIRWHALIAIASALIMLDRADAMSA